MRNHHSLGFLLPSLTPYLAIAAAVVLVGALGWAKVQGARLEAAQANLATEKASFAVFKEGVRKAGDAQEAKNKETLKQRETINAKALKTLQNRYSDLDARYARLREQSGHPGSGQLPSVPDATRPADDSARDNRLLEVLEYADQQTAQLIELQEWVKSNVSNP